MLLSNSCDIKETKYLANSDPSSQVGWVFIFRVVVVNSCLSSNIKIPLLHIMYQYDDKL